MNFCILLTCPKHVEEEILGRISHRQNFRSSFKFSRKIKEENFLEFLLGFVFKAGDCATKCRQPHEKNS
jgi:hypothetical protein